MDDFQRILTIAGHRDAGHHFAFAVEFGEPPTLVGCQLDPCDVADQHRRALVGLDHQAFNIVLAAQVALAAHHVLGLGHFHHAATYIPIGVADHLGDLHQRNAIGAQFHRIDSDLIGLHEATNRSDFRHAMGLGQLIAQIPVLDRAQFGEGLVLGQQRVLIHPADAGGVRPDLRCHPLGHAAGSEIEIFQHPRARPVDVSAILEDDVDEGRPEEREAAHHLGLGHRQHRRGERIGDLVLDHLRRLAGVFGVDDDLHVGQIGQRVDGGAQHRKDAGGENEKRGEQNQEAVPARPVDDFGQHDGSCVSGLREDWQPAPTWLLCRRGPPR